MVCACVMPLLQGAFLLDESYLYLKRCGRGVVVDYYMLFSWGRLVCVSNISTAKITDARPGAPPVNKKRVARPARRTADVFVSQSCTYSTVGEYRCSGRLSLSLLRLWDSKLISPPLRPGTKTLPGFSLKISRN